MFTSQAAAARATDSTWIAAPAQPAAVCIVDTGNDPNPDTTNVIARLSVDGGSGADLDTTGHHGTLMSMIASAPYNGFGMVGAAPSVKVVSVRAAREGGRFLFSDVLAGIETCRNQRLVYNIKVISLSLGVRNRWWRRLQGAGRRCCRCGRCRCHRTGYRANLGGAPRTVTHRVPIRGRRFRAAITLPKPLAGAPRATISVTYGGDPDTSPATARTLLRTHR